MSNIRSKRARTSKSGQSSVPNKKAKKSTATRSTTTVTYPNGSEPKKDSRFWLEDGNVVLRAEDSLFRVHRSILSLNSQVFKDMFAMPQPVTLPPEESVDGCPLVFLSDKSADIEVMLSNFYEMDRRLQETSRVSMESLFAILRLGKKYEIHYLWEIGLGYMGAEFPRRLFAFQLNRGIPSRTGIDYGSKPKSDAIISIVNLAHELGIQSILPAAYFLLTSNGIEAMLNATKGDVLLHPGAMDCCLIGHGKIVAATVREFRGLNDRTNVVPASDCKSRDDCLLLYSKHTPLALHFSDGMKCFDNEYYNKTGLCDKCHRQYGISYNAIQSQIWEQLPTLFGLPGWEDLKDEI